MYKVICKSTDLIVGRGIDTVIITGWTKPQNILSRIPLEEFAVMGTLFSRSIGVEYLIRNLLANPQITCIHCLSLSKADDNSLSIQILKDLWDKGAAPYQNHWKIRSRKADVYLQNDIPLDALFDLVMNVKLYVWRSLDVIDFNYPKGIPREKAYELPFESKKVDSLALPYGHTITAPNIPSGWLKLLSRVRRYGSLVPNNWQGMWQELLNLSVTITFECSEFEFPSYLPCTEDDLSKYYELMCSDKLFDNVAYTYGRRIKRHFGYNQLTTIKDKMLSDNFTNHGVVNLWDATDIINNTCPCLTQLWFKISLEGKLNAFAIFRSHDLFSAWVQNIFGVRQLQRELMSVLRSEMTFPLISLGNLTVNSLSAHIYDFAISDVDLLLQENYKPIEDYNDPIGSFLVNLNNTVVTVYNEKFGASYEIMKAADIKRVMQSICNDFPTIEPYHAMYLGQEIERAFSLRTFDGKYQQM